jgi:hypothetical protein
MGTLPSKPQLIRRVDDPFQEGELSIEWDGPSNLGGVDLVSYEVWLDDGAGDFSGSLAPVATPGPEETALTITGLSTGSTYGIKMKAINEIGYSIDSDVVYLACAAKPGVPNAPVEESSSRSSITLAWNEPTESFQAPVTGYLLYMNALSVGDWVLVYKGEGYPTRQVYVVGDLTAGQQYRFMTGAINSVGVSLNSSEAIFTASDFPVAPGQP